MAKSNRLIIGLDYGTTYTGVSFCETSANSAIEKHIQLIQDWPASHTKIGTREKVPSEISYQKEGTLWGSSIPPDKQRHIWTKLELENQSTGEAARVQQETSSAALGLYKQPVDIIADFLSQVKAHLFKNLDQRYGEDLWRTLPITLVVTMPAVWSDKAKARTRQAVDQAGFNAEEFPGLRNIIDATEPECAAIYTMHSLRETVHESKFSKGDGFIVCDMGGGTVDLISYEVLASDFAKIREVTVGTGGQCGGTFVDRAFLKWLEGRLGTEDFVKIAGCRADSLPRTMLAKKAAGMVQDFIIQVKSGFSGTGNFSLPLPMPLGAIEDDEERGIEDGEIKITSEDLIGMFNGPVARVYELLNNQYNQAKKAQKIDLKYVFLVGGFSESPYMYKKIQEWATDHNTKAIRPTYAWSAVVRGAVLKGLQDDMSVIASRKNRRHYGTSVATHFDPRKHKQSDALIDRYDGIKRARCQMNWLLKQGMDLPTAGAAHAKIEMTGHFWLTEKRECRLSLLASNNAKAPKSSAHKDVFVVTSITVDLSSVPDKEFRVCRSRTGKVYHSLSYSIELAIQASMELSLVVSGKKYGSLRADFE